MGLPGQKEKVAEYLFKEIIAEDFPNLGKELDVQVHKPNRSPYLNGKRPSSSHVIIKLSGSVIKKHSSRKPGEKIKYPPKEHPLDPQQTSQQKPHRPGEWNDIFKILKGKNCHPKVFYLAKLPFRYGEIKTFQDKQKLREFTNSRPALQEMLEEALSSEMKRQNTQNFG